MKGVSMTIAVGKWAKPHAAIGEYTARLCLGFLAITFYTLDIEEFMTFLQGRAR